MQREKETGTSIEESFPAGESGELAGEGGSGDHRQEEGRTEQRTELAKGRYRDKPVGISRDKLAAARSFSPGERAFGYSA